jgi:hypothetical protein
MSENPMEPQNSTDILIWMIATQLLAVISVVVWYLMVTDLPMLFSDHSGGVLFLVIIYYPLYPIGMIIYSWMAYSSRKKSLAAILSGLSTVPIVVWYFALIIISAIDRSF